MSTGKIERTAVTAVVDYLDKVDKFEPFISYSDKAPITDGYFNIYKNEQQKVENFFAQIPVQVKGTASDKDYYFRIGREHVDAYKQLGGIVFFKVIVNETTPTILYAILSLDRINELQKQSTKEIRIDLNEVPTDPQKFETEIFAFASKRNGEKVETSSPKEIADLVKGFENIRKYLGEIKDNEVQYDLESLLDSIKNTKDDGTIGWRDKFIYYSRKALDLAANNLKYHDFTHLQHNFGFYLQKQKQYHLVEDYYLKSLADYCNLAKVLPIPPFKSDVATALNNLGNLHSDLTRYKEAELEYLLALKIYRELAKTNRDTYITDVAMTLNNLGNLHMNLTRYEEAEQEYQEALDIYCKLLQPNRDAYIYYYYLGTTLNNLAVLHANLNQYEEAEKEWIKALRIRRKLAETNRDAYIADLAQTLNNLAALHTELTCYEEAEQEYQEALRIRRELVKTNRNAYIADLAQTLNHLAELHYSLTRYNEAEQECLEALEIYRELAKTNHDVYILYVASTLNNLAEQHRVLFRFKEAEQKYNEAIKIFRDLANTNREAYIGYVAKSLFNLALLLQVDEKRLDEARAAANEALGICKELANKYPQIWNKDVEDTQRLLDELNAP